MTLSKWARQATLGLAFLLLFGATSASRLSSVFSPHSRRLIPSQVILNRVASSDARALDLNDLIYEINDDNELIGNNVHVNLLKATKPQTQRAKSTSTYTVNGEVQNAIPEAQVRSGNGYTVVYNLHHKTILNVWTDKLFLEPLHPSNYPGIFINTHGLSTKSNQHLPPPLPSLNTTMRQSGGCRTVEVAVAFDNSFCALFSNSADLASAYVQATFNYADGIYKRDLCHSITLVHIEAHCNDNNDPYRYGNGASASSILANFRTFWQSSRPSVHRDLAYFFSGFEDGTSTVGIASVGAACGSFGYGWVELGSGPTLVHEIGHNLGATHTTQGIMKGSSSKGDPVFFSETSKSQIAQFMQTPQSGCIDTAAPKCDAKCPGGCVNGHCVALYADAKPKGLVPCVPVKNLFKCTDKMTFGSRELFYGKECDGRFGFISPQGEEDAFCCLPPEESKTEGVISVDYAFVGLTLQGGSGDNFLEYYIQNPGDIKDETLMVTKLVPSCKAAGATQPPATTPQQPSATTVATGTTAAPTTAAPTTAAPTTVAATTVATTTVAAGTTVGVGTTAPSAPAAPSSKRTCGETLKASQTFVCSTWGGRYSITELSGAIEIKVEQMFGEFQATLTALNGLEMRELKGKMSTDGGLTGEDLGKMKPLKGGDRKEVSVVQNAFGVETEGNCCGERLFVYLKMRVCRKECVTTVLTVSLRMVCGEPCGGEFLPFSKGRECPECKE